MPYHLFLTSPGQFSLSFVSLCCWQMQVCQLVLSVVAGLIASLFGGQITDLSVCAVNRHRFVSLCYQQTQVCQSVLSVVTGLIANASL